MIIGYTSTIDAYRARTAAMRPTVLSKPKCPVHGCGKQIHSETQRKRYGKCTTCQRAEEK